jgi:chemotaxis protein CheC
VISLDEDARDALVEIFNLGVSKSAVALSQMVGAEVRLSTPDFEVIRIDQIAEKIAQGGDLACVVREDFRDGLDGGAMLVFTEQEGLRLVARLLDSPFPLPKLAEAEAEALSEVGNIILNACLAQIADALQIYLETSLPVCQVVGMAKWIPSAGSGMGPNMGTSEAILLKVNLNVEERGIMGYLIFLLDVRSTVKLKSLLAAFVQRLGA